MLSKALQNNHIKVELFIKKTMTKEMAEKANTKGFSGWKTGSDYYEVSVGINTNEHAVQSMSTSRAFNIPLKEVIRSTSNAVTRNEVAGGAIQ